MKEKGFTQVVTVGVLAIGLVASVYLAGQKTGLFPRASSISKPGTPPPSAGPTKPPPITQPVSRPDKTPFPTHAPSAYFLDQSTHNVRIPPSDTKIINDIYVVLKDKATKKPVARQDNFSYEWSIDDPRLAKVNPYAFCVEGVLSPCPFGHANITTFMPRGSARIYVVVKNKTTGMRMADAMFRLTVNPIFGPTSSPKPTPIPTPIPRPTPIACTPCQANVTKSGKVSFADIMAVIRCFGRSAADRCVAADVNGNGRVEYTDLNCVWRNMGKTCTVK